MPNSIAEDAKRMIITFECWFLECSSFSTGIPSNGLQDLRHQVAKTY